MLNNRYDCTPIMVDLFCHIPIHVIADNWRNDLMRPNIRSHDDTDLSSYEVGHRSELPPTYVLWLNVLTNDTQTYSWLNKRNRWHIMSVRLGDWTYVIIYHMTDLPSLSKPPMGLINKLRGVVPAKTCLKQQIYVSHNIACFVVTIASNSTENYNYVNGFIAVLLDI